MSKRPLKLRSQQPRVVQLRRSSSAMRTASTRVGRVVLLVLRVVLATVFIVSGAIKLFAPVEEFMASIDTFGLSLPVAFVRVAAYIIPWIELFIGLLLLLGVLMELVLWMYAGMMMMFIALIAQGLIRGLELDCGCFGNLDIGSSPLATLLRDVVLLGCALVLLRWRPRLWSFDAWK